jgi:cytochrome c oxidase subunit 4
MSDPHAAPAGDDHSHDGAHVGHISDSTFMKVFIGLLIFTAVSFLTNQVLGSSSPAMSFIIIGAVAVCKALLVVTFFMHLKFDWKRIIMFVVPTMILAPLIVIVLWPDIVSAWRLAP